MQLAKLVSEETLVDIGRQLVLRHKPLKPDYLGKFGIEARTLVAPAAIPMAVREPEPAPFSSAVEGSSGNSPESEEKKNKLICVSCGAKVTYNVAKFCWNNKTRFGGDVFCMQCQKKVKPNGA